MAYTETNYKSKKELKESVKNGDEVRCYQPGLGKDLDNYTGEVSLEGPHYPKPHTWYSRVMLVNGVVTKVVQ